MKTLLQFGFVAYSCVAMLLRKKDMDDLGLFDLGMQCEMFADAYDRLVHLFHCAAVLSI